MNKFEISATTSFVSIDMKVETIAQAQEIAAKLPKSVKAIATTCSDENLGRCGLVSIRAGIAATGVNGGKNETGIKRIKTALKNIAALGYEVEWRQIYANSMSEAEFIEAVA